MATHQRTNDATSAVLYRLFLAPFILSAKIMFGKMFGCLLNQLLSKFLADSRRGAASVSILNAIVLLLIWETKMITSKRASDQSKAN